MYRKAQHTSSVSVLEGILSRLKELYLQEPNPEIFIYIIGVESKISNIKFEELKEYMRKVLAMLAEIDKKVIEIAKRVSKVREDAVEEQLVL